MPAAPAPPRAHAPRPAAKVRLVGTVAGVDACEILTDRHEVVIGSGVDCDLVIHDPVAPRRAFRLRYRKEHAPARKSCAGWWELEAYPGSRVYLNNDLARRERIAFGDRLAVGCHHFLFSPGDAVRREHKSLTNVKDVCASLLSNGEPPAGYLHGLPSWRDRLRIQRAAWCGAGLGGVLLLLFLLVPRVPKFEPLAPSVNVTLRGERPTMPPPDAIKSLETVLRKSFAEAAPVAEAPNPPLLSEGELAVLAMQAAALTSAAPAPTAPDALASPGGPPDLAASLGPLAFADAPALTVDRGGVTLATAAVARRVVADAANGGGAPAELQTPIASVQKSAPAAQALQRSTREATDRAAAMTGPKFDEARAAAIAAFKYSPTPVDFTNYGGARIPIARIPDPLPSLAAETGEAKVEVDGKISEKEIALSFKTGQFKVHGPNAQLAEPATFCYVTKTTENGRDFLYISFDCRDPNLAALVLRHTQDGDPKLAEDDSIEFFIDLDGDRVSYHQLIVNARGNVYSAFCPNGEVGINGLGTPWDAGAKVKTTINSQAGNWVCEIQIPYDRLPGPRAGTQVPVNFCRNFRGQGAGGTLQNWFAVWDGSSSNYHHPGKFGVIEWK